MHLNSILLPFVVFCPFSVCVHCSVHVEWFHVFIVSIFNTLLLHITGTSYIFVYLCAHHIDTKHSPIYLCETGKNTNSKNMD